MVASPSNGVRTVGRGTYVLGALGGGIRGYELGVVAGALLYAGPALGLTPLTTGWVVSAALTGSLLGALASGHLADRYGRRRLIAAGGALYVIGILGAALSPNAGLLITSRVVLGVAVGVATSMIPVYLSEIAPALRRGSYSALFQVLITVGVLLASIVSLALSPSGAWRWMFGIGVLPALVMLAGAYRLPESPRWLVRQGRESEARAVLAGSRSPEEVDVEVAAIQRIDAQEGKRLHLGAVLRVPQLRRLLLVGSGLGVLQQLIGINAITYYAPRVLTSIGYSDTAAIAANLGLSTLGLVMTVVMAFFVVDRLGRKKPLVYGALLMALSMAVLGSVFAGSGTAGGAAGWVAIACLALFQVAFALSWGGIVWVVLGEMFPLALRGTAMGVAVFMTELVSVIVGLVFPTLLQAGPSTVFFGFAVMGVLACLWAALMIPETKDRSLEDIEADLGLGDVDLEPPAGPAAQAGGRS